ncbi:helix-turn-helix domain-containing protein [Cohnella ginsengisoli]|uniref:Helix-turn-helix domain-containing protein n=1 Tax=Cohnella ginsengisoli TaxID=425004 RepID=A0A9X4KEC0_9BACL|nr:helix-turn-helix domain-containing protein [Cohnella ginsengisoli]MDG0790483.1 helix-turn-helix domain-containing protein [Cohnella ginsengisoli]
MAARLGLTVHTVSKALRGLPGMSESTRRDIWQAARELGYRTKAQAAGLSAEQIPWVGAGKPRRFAMVMAGEGPFLQPAGGGARPAAA